MTCGIIFPDFGRGHWDEHGCRLPEYHEGPHEFVMRGDRVIRWETDWACNCDECMKDDGDWCVIYREVSP